MVDNPSTLCLIPSALEIINKALPGQREPWVIVPGRSIEKNYSGLTLGKDTLDNVLVIPSMSQPSYLIRLPHINVNSSRSSLSACEVVDGVYLYVAHYHRWGRAGSYPAFFITHFSSLGPLDISTLAHAYRSSNRVNLPIVGGGYDSYINFHRSNRTNDGSEGCWTCPEPDFDIFRSSYHDLQWGIVIKATNEPSAGLNAIKDIRRHYGV